MFELLKPFILPFLADFITKVVVIFTAYLTANHFGTPDVVAQLGDHLQAVIIMLLGIGVNSLGHASNAAKSTVNAAKINNAIATGNSQAISK